MYIYTHTIIRRRMVTVKIITIIIVTIRSVQGFVESSQAEITRVGGEVGYNQLEWFYASGGLKKYRLGVELPASHLWKSSFQVPKQDASNPKCLR